MLVFAGESYMDSFVQEMKEFFTAIAEDKETPVRAIDALRPVQIAKVAGESLKTGQSVKVQY